MLTTKKILAIFIPTLILTGVVLFIRITQYEPLYPKTNQKQQDKQKLVNIPIFDTDPISGYKKAPSTIIAFVDFACPACKQQNSLLNELEKLHPKQVKIIWKGLPVSTYPFDSREAHKFGFCANQQGKFELFKEYAYTNSDNLSTATLDAIIKEMGIKENKITECLKSPMPELSISKNEQLALILNIQDVPTFFVDNIQILTPKSVTEWESILGL